MLLGIAGMAALGSVVSSAEARRGSGHSAFWGRPVRQSVITVSNEAEFINAISSVPDGGTIEMNAGTYSAPGGGFGINNQTKDFTVRAASPGTVVLSGNNSDPILRFINSDPSLGGQVTFRDLRFENGQSTTPGLAGGVTLHRARAVFVNCEFRNNVAANGTGGGAMVVALGSQVSIAGSILEDNNSQTFGGAMTIHDGSGANIHQTRFSRNLTNLPGHDSFAAGGALHVIGSTVHVSESRFEDNEAGYVGGAVYVLGVWGQTEAELSISNSTFDGNQARRAAGGPSPPTEGGAFHAEDNARAVIDSSRFLYNSADTGGGVNLYRAVVEIRNSVFRGNQAVGSGSANGFGGAISAISNDGSPIRTASLTVEDSFILGRDGSVTTVGQAGGAIYTAGDFGSAGGGSGDGHRAMLVIRRTAIADADVIEGPSAAGGTGLGGAILADLADLVLEDSIIILSSATGSTNGWGGAAAIINRSQATISSTTFGRNYASRSGGALFVQGSSLSINQSLLIYNEVPTGSGSAVYSEPDSSRDQPITGSIESSVIGENLGRPLYEGDLDSSAMPNAINDLRYNSNQIYSSLDSDIFLNILSGLPRTVSELNGLTVTRANAADTPKVQQANTAPGVEPVSGALLAAPTFLWPMTPPGDPAPPTSSYLAYAWGGGPATVDGGAVANNAGWQETNVAKLYTLSVGGMDFTDIVTELLPVLYLPAIQG